MFLRTSGSPPVRRSFRTPALDEGRAEPVEFLERQHVLLRQERHVLRHAIDAAEVAAVGHRDAQIGDRPAERVDQRGAERGIRERSRTSSCRSGAIGHIAIDSGARACFKGLMARIGSERWSREIDSGAERSLADGDPAQRRIAGRFSSVSTTGRNSTCRPSFSACSARRPRSRATARSSGRRSAGKIDVTIAAVDPVGNYAVRLTFSDRHNSGLFSWPYLRKLGEERDALWAGYLRDLEAKGMSRAPVARGEQV